MNRKKFGISLVTIGVIFMLTMSPLVVAGIIVLALGIAELHSYKKRLENSDTTISWGRVAIIGVGILVLTFLLFPEAETAQPQNTQLDQQTVGVSPPTREELLQLVNEERAKVGVAPLSADPMLEESAQWKADDMVTFSYFDHKRPGESVNNGLDYLAKLDLEAGDRCSYIGENIVDNVNVETGEPYDNTSIGAVNAWVNSEPHHKAMIDPKYTLTGFGISGTKVVEHFCQQ